ncbi:MAG: hypothetical protein OIN66_01355 [Candidatus Methanoperedens sp.]|nr:hypothetical protein [Candidatus Methanoperedens sp.]
MDNDYSKDFLVEPPIITFLCRFGWQTAYYITGLRYSGTFRAYDADVAQCMDQRWLAGYSKSIQPETGIRFIGNLSAIY